MACFSISVSPFPRSYSSSNRLILWLRQQTALQSLFIILHSVESTHMQICSIHSGNGKGLMPGSLFQSIQAQPPITFRWSSEGTERGLDVENNATCDRYLAFPIPLWWAQYLICKAYMYQYYTYNTIFASSPAKRDNFWRLEMQYENRKRCTHLSRRPSLSLSHKEKNIDHSRNHNREN